MRSTADRALLLPRGAQREQRLPVFHRLAILNEYANHLAADVRFDLVHQFHGLDDANHLPDGDIVTDLDERIGVRTGRSVIGADDWRLDDVEFLLFSFSSGR